MTVQIFQISETHLSSIQFLVCIKSVISYLITDYGSKVVKFSLFRHTNYIYIWIKYNRGICKDIFINLSKRKTEPKSYFSRTRFRANIQAASQAYSSSCGLMMLLKTKIIKSFRVSLRNISASIQRRNENSRNNHIKMHQETTRLSEVMQINKKR